MSRLIASYRIQANRDCNFVQIRDLVPYLNRLGIANLYLSPISTARPDSAHGYDVIDPTRLNPELGTEADFTALVEELQTHNMGLVLDIVPNHMLATIENPWWADVLMHGRDSQWARYFDIDWTDDGKIVLPVLGTSVREALAAGDLRIDTSGEHPTLRYHDHAYPLAPGTDTNDIQRALAQQHYTLAYWRDAHPNYRRFFDVDHLIGVRQEDEEVFETTHSLVRNLLYVIPRGAGREHRGGEPEESDRPQTASNSRFSALRVDHIDGLLDPAQYLDDLARLAGDTPLLVEKILSGDERIPESWPFAGTTGYEFLNMTNSLFVDPAGLDALRSGYATFTARDGSFADVVYGSKRQVARQLFPGELARLARDLKTLASEEAVDSLEDALVALAAAFPVYRTHVDANGITDPDGEVVRSAAAEARRRGDAGPALDALARVLLLDIPDDQLATSLAFVQRWQQFTGPLAAKGLEDTALYRYNVLLSMNEVGADPAGPAPTSADSFHDFNLRRLKTPDTLNATATHDTKRGEDVRARLNVLSELAGEWTAAQQRWAGLNSAFKQDVAGAPAPDANDETLLYQTLVGAWPVDEAELPQFRQRVRGYLLKAAREAKEHTSWLEPNGEYEEALVQFTEALLDSKTFLDDFRPFQQRIARLAITNSLAQTLLKVSSPGVPDVYQGTELWDLNLVDPDNRRPVDFERRRDMLDEISNARVTPEFVRELLDTWHDARVKLFVLYRALAFRRDHAALFAEGDYLPLETTGVHADRIVAFARRHNDAWAIVAVPRLTAGLRFPPLGNVWQDTAVHLPADAPATWRNVLNGEDVSAQDGYLPAAALFAHLPVALLTAPAGQASASAGM